jgi:hypothetical protein
MAPRRKSFAELKGLKFAIPAPASVGEQSILNEVLMKACLQGVRDYNDALKDGRTAGPNAEEIIDAVTDIVDMSFAKAAVAELGPYKGRTG